MNEQTQLKVRTNRIDDSITQTGGTLTYLSGPTSGVIVDGDGTESSPYTGYTTSTTGLGFVFFYTENAEGVLHYSISGSSSNAAVIAINYNIVVSSTIDVDGSLNVERKDLITVLLPLDETLIIWYEPQYEEVYEWESLDLYQDIPIKLTRSFAEIQDISKKNSDYTVGIKLPGTKKNNRFFENFFSVDNVSYNFDPRKRIQCDILINSDSQFSGYMKLNKINIKNTTYEYDVTLYSTIGNIIGAIGNNKLVDLNFSDTKYYFNHTFNGGNIIKDWVNTPFTSDDKPPLYVYPIIHNGYKYDDNDDVNFTYSAETGWDDVTRLYDTTSPIDTYATLVDATNAGVEENRINSPSEYIIENQLKPSLSYWGLLQLLFKTYGYSIKSDFLNTPWVKSLYMYGPFSSDQVKLSYRKPNPQTLPVEQVDVIYTAELRTWQISPPPGDILTFKTKYYNFTPVIKGTTTPCYCSDDITIAIDWIQNLGALGSGDEEITTYVTIPAGDSTTESIQWVQRWMNVDGGIIWTRQTRDFQRWNTDESNVSVFPKSAPYSLDESDKYQEIKQGDFMDFSLILDGQYKQIDFLSSFIKKFNLLLFPNPDNPKEIIIEPFDYYVGTGNIYDWTDKLSYDKGFSIQPAQNVIENSIELTEKEGTDSGNLDFKNKLDRIYGRNIKTSPTEFKSKGKKIETTYTPSVYRYWGDYNRYPLMINYLLNSEDDEGIVKNFYKGVKTKPKLFWYLGSYNPFVKQPNQTFDPTLPYNTYQVKLQASVSGSTNQSSDTIPLIYNNSSIGLLDDEKVTNDSLSLLFETEEDVITTRISDTWLTANNFQSYDTYSNVNIYDRFYSNRINNIYDPNTRIISGYFNLGLNDVKNLMPNDLIKIQEQYFTWNKIDQYNLTSDELTKVELVQHQVTPKEYPVRYFKYYYCDNANYSYVFKTDFTNESPMKTNQFFSVTYDYFMGVKKQLANFYSNLTGYTSLIYEYSTGYYYKYNIVEITKEEYENTNYYDWTLDPLLRGLENLQGQTFRSLFPYFVTKTTGGKRINLFNHCSDPGLGNFNFGTPGNPLTKSGDNFYDYEVTINDGTILPNEYPVTYYDISGNQKIAIVTNLEKFVIEGVREYSLETEYTGISWEKVRYYDTTVYDPTTGLKDPPDDSDLDNNL